MPAADEQQLIRQAQEGNHAAYRLLMETHMRQAYNVAFGFVNDRDAAKDVVQEAFIRAYRSLGAFRGESAFGTWIHRIVANLAMNHVKQSQRRVAREVSLEHAMSLVSTHDASLAADGAIRDHIERALHDLPTLQRAVVILRHLNGLSTRQVSMILKVSEGTVKTHLFRGLRNLRKTLQYLQEEL